MIGTIVTTIIIGAIIGLLARAILPGGQDIGMTKTVGLGIVSNLIVGIVFKGLSAGFVMSIIIAAVVGAGLLWIAIRQRWLVPR